jgi:hypothetical protein
MTDISYLKQQAAKNYPFLWRQMIEEWKSDSAVDSLWVTYSANYLLNLGGFRWAIDPFSLFTRIGGGEQPNFASDLEDLKLVVLTHAHNDHLDLNLIKAIQDLDIQWVIPRFMLDKIKQSADIEDSKIIIPKSGKLINLENLKLTPFEALHFRGDSGVEEMGYLVEFDGMRWLFPGDTRSYDFEKLPDFGKLDGVIAHLWLGKAEAMMDMPSLLMDFCSFFTKFQTNQIIVAHLYEYGREREDFWGFHHFQMVKTKIHQITPDVKLSAALMGERILLK